MKYCPVCEKKYDDTQNNCVIDGALLVAVSVDPLIGQILKDQYRIESHIGEGGMAAVYKATQLQLSRSVAIKVMLEHVQASPEYVKRFFREARLLSQLNHPNVVSIIDFGNTNDGLIFMVMELLVGESLDEYVPQDRGLNTTDILDIMQQMCAGVSAAHEIPLIHRDLKPSNIFLGHVTGAARVVKVLDFGISKNLEQEDDIKTQTGIVMGTPGYMSPEQILAAETPGTRSDIYALGAILYFMMSGLRPYSGNTSNSVLIKQTLEAPDNIDPARYAEPAVASLMKVALKAMSIEVEDRYATAEEMLQAVKETLSQAPTAVERLAETVQRQAIVQPKTAGKDSPKKKLGFIAASIAGLAIAAVVGLGLLGKLPGFDRTETLTFGMTAAFSGPSETLGREMRVGIETYFRVVNAAGGVNGYKLKLHSLDDGYEPERALANVKTLLEKNKVFAIIGSTGTPTAKVAIPFTSERKKLLFGALTGAGLLRQDPPDRYVMNYRASYAEETAAMVHYFTEVKDIPANEIAVFSQNDSYGDSGFLGVEKTLRHSEGRAKVALHVRYERNSTHVQTAIDQLLSRPDIKAVVMVGTYKATSKFIKGVMDGGMKPLFASVSFVGSRPLAERLHEMGPEYAEGVVVTQVVPFYHSNATGVLKYRADLKQYYPQESPSFISLEGYVVAEILVEGIRRVSGEVTTESLISALESIKELDLGIGTILSFAPSRHQASDKVWGAILGRDGQYQSLDLE